MNREKICCLDMYYFYFRGIVFCSSFFLISCWLPEYLTELREYGAIYSSWAGLEEQLQRPLEGVAGCVTTSCVALEDLSDTMSQDFLPVLREYVLYIESMKVRAGKNAFRSTQKSQRKLECCQN